MTKKCIAVHVPIDLLDKINEQKTKTGQSQRILLPLSTCTNFILKMLISKWLVCHTKPLFQN